MAKITVSEAKEYFKSTMEATVGFKPANKDILSIVVDGDEVTVNMPTLAWKFTVNRSISITDFRKVMPEPSDPENVESDEYRTDSE